MSPPNSASLHEPSASRVRLFVYGTLKRGHCRAGVLAGQRFLGPGRTVAAYRLVDCGSYPGLIETPEGGLQIHGEVWEVDGACLAELDRVEGVELDLYRRVPVQLEPPFDKTPVQTYLYLRNVAGRPDCGSAWPAR